jgi:hypothetical protein
MTPVCRNMDLCHIYRQQPRIIGLKPNNLSQFLAYRLRDP